MAQQPQIWGAVPLQNPDFVGREELLEQLRVRLLEPSAAAAVLPEVLHGMGGVGKSQIAVEYVYRHASEYDVVWWIPSEHPTLIRSSFVDLAKRLGIKASSAETAVPAVLEALRSGAQGRHWILVFDNAENPDVIRAFLPPGGGHVLVTSRNAEWAGVARTVEVDLFTRDESMQLLRRLGRGITDEDADRLAEALGDLPLAVEQAASWRAQTGMPVAEYVDLLEKNSAELLQAGATGEYELPVAAAWNVPLNRLKTDRRGALELLQVCAFFSPEPISRSLFSDVRGAPVPAALAEAFGDPVKLNLAIREINRYSLAKIDHSRNTLQLHRLVQAVLRDQLDRAQWDDMRHSVHLMLANADPGDPGDSANWPAYADLLPHAIRSRLFGCQRDDEECVLLAANLRRYLVNSGGSYELSDVEESSRRDVAGAGGSGENQAPDTYHTIFFADIAGYSSELRTTSNYKALLKGMFESIQRAFAEAEIPWDDCYRRDNGDGILVAAPAHVPRDRFAGPLLKALLRMLRAHNKKHPATAQLKLRVALHTGEVELSEHGLLGPAVIHASRLLDAAPLRKALAKSSGPLAVIVSEGFYTDVVWKHDDHAPAEYRKVRVKVKKTRANGWVRVPGHTFAPTPRWRQVLESLIR